MKTKTIISYRTDFNKINLYSPDEKRVISEECVDFNSCPHTLILIINFRGNNHQWFMITSMDVLNAKLINDNFDCYKIPCRLDIDVPIYYIQADVFIYEKCCKLFAEFARKYKTSLTDEFLKSIYGVYKRGD